MNEFREAIKCEQRRIQSLINLTAESGSCEKRGVLVLDRRGTGIYCYEKRGKSKIYLGKSDSDAARDLAKSRFLAEKRKRLYHDAQLLQKLQEGFQDYSFDAVMSGLPRSYTSIIKEDFNNERYEELKQWAKANYVQNTVPFPDAGNYAMDGRRVRSKGECLIANALIEMGIPFRYDCVITITDDQGYSKKVSPDFMIQNFDYSLTIIEHLGRLFDKRYALDFGEKCYWYQQDGYVLGQNFFVTSDGNYGGTDTRSIQDVAKLVWQRFISEA